MSKISRVYQKLFGASGNVSYFGKFGSKAAAAPVNTQDPATIQALAAFDDGWQDAVISGSKPCLEDMNSLFLLAFRQIAYIMQAGVPEWDASTTYYIGSIVNVSGAQYVSKTDTNLNNNPVTSTTNWQLAAGEQPGFVKDFCGPTANIPTGYLTCDGSAVSRTTYANLYAAIGNYWGAGDGSTTFNLPNLKGAVTVGYDSTQTEFNAVGKTGGEKTHLLTSAESGVPAHTHTSGGVSSGVTGADHHFAGTESQWTYTTNANTPADASTAHNNLQPYGTVLKVIKY